ncbi:MAG: hypothetical protein J7574_13325 [Flavobacterium sp.]|uniref:DUF6169 family protein n=1 Tax=Flavobacterium sp. TaxID=239 RepID=UPI001B1B1316|nr:DUF6169 family protein [Flavobacterium sp.]MBO9585136.1 hypothetical protein [Flavobacterium sp.]
MYQYISEEGLSPLFYFIKKYDLKYFVSFRKVDFENDYFENLFFIDFYESNNQKFYNDPHIETTIITIISDYFKRNPNVIISYVCDIVDYKQDFRKRLFDKWYKNFNDNKFSKINFQYEIENNSITYHLSLIFRSELYKEEELIENVNLQLEEFTNLK